MWEMSALERRYSVPPSTLSDPSARYRTTEDLHAWSIYRQNLNSDFTDSALGTGEKTQPPFGNFQLRESTVHTIINHPKYGPRERGSHFGSNVFTYLRFGLPRVLPIRTPRETSSGYDSSDDASPYADRRRAKSDPDFRNHVIRTEEVVPAGETSFGQHLKVPQAPVPGGLRRLKASSEADLLSNEVYSIGGGRWSDNKANSALGIRPGHPGRAHEVHEVNSQLRFEPPSSHIGNGRRSHAGSKAGSHLSLASRGSRPPASSVVGDREREGKGHDGFYGLDGPLLNDKLFPRDTFYAGIADGEATVKHHPHLQVRNLSFEMDLSSAWKRMCGGARTKLRLLEGLNFEVRGGEVLAIMATSETEGTSLMDILANRHRKWRSRLRGEILVNGLHTTPAKLEPCVAYAPKDVDLFPNMSARQTLLFAALLRKPCNERDFDTKARINALLEDLGLGPVKHTRVRDLTESEMRRLKVACHLLLDTDIVLLDQPTLGMDVFDAFFLVEYLRQWASRGRIVIITLQPPTYEIFSMVARVALVSTGRMLYHGKRKDMLPYFAYIDFPCPAYKNPSDYYLDLVTLDNLSPEAMLESSQRVENLVEVFRRRQEAMSDPGPPGQAPGSIRRANFFTQVLALWIRALIFQFPYNVVGLAGEVFLSALMSVLVGAVFWNVRLGREQEHVADRLGLYHVLMALSVWPLILVAISKSWRDRLLVLGDVREGLYGKMAYLTSKAVSSIPVGAAVMVSYALPAYSMAGLEAHWLPTRSSSYGAYIGFMLLYLLTIRTLATACAWLAPASKYLAAALTGIFMTLLSCTAGYVVHTNDLAPALSWFRFVSPQKWIMEQLMVWEFQEARELDGLSGGDVAKYYCSHNPIVHQDSAILVRADCGFRQDADALRFFGFRSTLPVWQPVVIVVAFLIAFGIIATAALLLLPAPRTKKQKIRR